MVKYLKKIIGENKATTLLEWFLNNYRYKIGDYYYYPKNGLPQGSICAP